GWERTARVTGRRFRLRVPGVRPIPGSNVMTPRLRTQSLLALSLFAAALLVTPPAHAAVFVYNCVLSPIQENPVNTGTRAFGAGRFVIDTDANTATYRIVFSRLLGTESVAHIHGSATSVPGINASVLVSLPAGNPKVGV